MKKFLFLLYYLLIASGFYACRNGSSGANKSTKQNPFLPPSTGNLTELILVLPDHLWTSSVGEITRECFHSPLKGLPQKESLFNIFDINVSQFSSIFKSHKNILQFISSDSTYLESARSKWSNDQLYFCVYFQNEKQLMALLVRRGTEIRKAFLEKNQIRRVCALQKNRNLATEKEIQKSYNLSFLIPEGFEVALAEKDFLWLRRDISRLNVIDNIWVHRQAYKNKSQMNKSSLIALRDSIGKTFIKGGRRDSYMATEMLYDPSIILLNTDPYTLSMKGLWTMENDFLGGGFTSKIFLDQKNNSLIYAEGFLYSPNQKKRERILELDAILSTLVFE
jgi:hypothetical protein